MSADLADHTPKGAIHVSDLIQRVCIVTNGTAEANQAAARLGARYGDHPIQSCDVVIALGGDGF